MIQTWLELDTELVLLIPPIKFSRLSQGRRGLPAGWHLQRATDNTVYLNITHWAQMTQPDMNILVYDNQGLCTPAPHLSRAAKKCVNASEEPKCR